MLLPGSLPVAGQQLHASCHETKLCLACQKTALVEEMYQGRTAYRCPMCNDLTLAIEWAQVLAEFKQRGGYNVNLANED